MIEGLSGYLQHNLIVLLAVILVPLKLAILRMCGDTEAQRGALLSIPEDLVYVSLGLILGDLATSGGAFRKHFTGSSHMTMNLFVTGAIGLSVAVLIHVLAKWTNDNFKTWRAASSIRVRSGTGNPQQAQLPLSTMTDNVRRIQVAHVTWVALFYLAQLVVAIKWLAWIAGILANA